MGVFFLPKFGVKLDFNFKALVSPKNAVGEAILTTEIIRKTVGRPGLCVGPR